MKVYVSADIEGVAGIAAAAEANRAMPGDYAPLRRQMEAEVAAACRGAFAAGARDIVVKDAHASGRNLLLDDLDCPDGCALRLIRGWSGHPFAMVQDIDASFDAAIFIGFHCAAGEGGNPLAHTLNGALFARIELNGAIASELRLYGLAAASVGVPVAFVSGDRTVCAEAARLAPGIATLATFESDGPAVTSLLPRTAVLRIEAAVARALRGPRPAPLALPDRFALTLIFRNAADAFARSFYPGARRQGDLALGFESDDYLAVLTFLRFAARYA